MASVYERTCRQFVYCSTGVTIGFENTLIEDDELKGQVVVGVAILAGNLSQDVVVAVNTVDGAATSTSA